MNKIIKRTAIGAAVLVVVTALAWPKLDLKGSNEQTTSGTQAQLLSVEGVQVRPSLLTERVVTTGTLRANEEVELASEVSGKITDILFSEGSYVEEGRLLVKINDSEIVARRAQTLSRIRLAEQQVERQQALLEKGGISQEEFDLTQNQLRVLQAELELHEAQLAKTEVRAPFSGRVGLRQLSEGSYITPQTRIASLQDVSPIKIDFSLPEKYGSLVRIGSEIRFSTSGSPNVYRGTVYAVEPRINENTRTLQVRATSPNRDGSLMPGAFADIELVLAEHQDALSIPTIAVVPELGGKKVYVASRGQVDERSIETGIRTDSTVQVLLGLTEGDTVLTSGLQLVRTGMPIEVDLFGAAATLVPHSEPEARGE